MNNFSLYLLASFITLGLQQNISAETTCPITCPIVGQGSSAAAPFYDAVISQYNPLFPQAPASYASTGSGAGAIALLAQEINFAGTDNVLTPAQLASAPGPILSFPTAFVGVTLSYNLPGNPAIILDAAVLSGIYLGTILDWNDPAIVALNPGITLPAIPIIPVFRIDSSGTTQSFTTFLADSNVGYPSNLVGTVVDFPAPAKVGATGSAGVAATISSTTGSIGYLAFDFATSSGLIFASIINSSGNAIAPTLTSIAAAGEGFDLPSDLRFNTINSPNPQAYPIATPTFIDVFQNQPNNLVTRNIKQFLYFIATQGQLIAPTVNLAPLTSAMVSQFIINLLSVVSVATPNATTCNPPC